MSKAATPRDVALDIGRYQQRSEQMLDRYLTLQDPGTPRLLEAMRYSVLGGGKRLRPILVYCTGKALGAPIQTLDAPAAAVELIHAYSLVHDDLPAMDDDDLRRGRPTCHKAYDEGTAVLVGDALQALAFGLIAEDTSPGVSAAARLHGLRVLEQMHRRKTGALIQASVLLGAITANVSTGPELAALERFGAELGLAFQIQDDILDVAGDVATLGKQVGADAARDKPTYPSLLGLERSRDLARAARDRAIQSLAPLGPRAASLGALANFVVDRSH